MQLPKDFYGNFNKRGQQLLHREAAHDVGEGNDFGGAEEEDDN